MNAHVGHLAAADVIALPKDKVVRVRGRGFVADPSGALYWPDEHLLVVADLHLEKGSSYAARRVFLPPYDTAATLARLTAVVTRLKPRRVIALGDSFHDSSGAARLLAQDIQALRALQAGREWLWIAGNHDPAPSSRLEGDHARAWRIGGISLRHEPQANPDDGELAGHLHPVAIVGGRGGTVRSRCFLGDARRCILPAFGAYAGGLNVLDRTYTALFERDAPPFVHMLGRSAVFTVARHQCLAEGRGPAWRI